MPELAAESVVIGGFVPSLLLPAGRLPRGTQTHVGTRDLDLGLSLALRSEARAEEVERQLRRLAFRPDLNERQNPTRQRWIRTDGGRSITVDFMIEARGDERPPQTASLTRDLGATVMPAIELAFRDQETVELEGVTLSGERASARVRCCGPGAFVVLKALAFLRRSKDHERNKDAYDLDFVLKNYGAGPATVAERLRPLLDHDEARVAVGVLRDEWASAGARGPQRLALFLDRVGDEDLLNDAVGAVDALQRALDAETRVA